MLRLMRKNASSWIIKILLGIVILVFILWGTGSHNDKSANQVALVNDVSISMDEYRDTYYNLLESYRQRFGRSLDDEMIKMLQLKNQAVNNLINKTLILQEAGRLKIQIPDEELTNSVRGINAFNKNGTFDIQQYRAVLEQNRLTPEAFEANQREVMLVEKMRSFITDNAKVSVEEAYKWYSWDQASMNFDVVLFKPDNYKDIEPSEDEINDFYEKQKNNYRTDPEIKVRYLPFTPDSYRDKIEISEDEIKEYYETNINDFSSPKTIEARHILFKVDGNAPPEIINQKKEEAIKVLKMAKSNHDFAELAKKYSEGPSKDQGGYLGAFEKGSMVKPFSDKAFSMKTGEISEPVQTRFGWHIIKVEKINGESTLSERTAEPEIRSKLIDEKAKTYAYDEAASAYDISLEGDDLIQTAEEKNLQLETTDFFTKNNPAKGIKDQIKFTSAAFNLNVMEISDIIDLSDGYCIMQVIEKTPAAIPELKDVKAEVIPDLVKKIQDAKAAEDANTMLAALKKGSSLSEESKKFNMNITTTGLIKRNDSIQGIGYEQNITDAAFKLSSGNTLPDNVLKGQKGYFIIKFNDKKAPAHDGFENEKKKIIENLLRHKKLKIFETWLSQIKESTDIYIEKEFLE